MHNVLSFFPDKTENGRADHHTGEKVTEYRTKAEPLCERHHYNRRSEVDHCLEKNRVLVHRSSG